MIYKLTPNYCVAHNAKAACTSISRAIVETFYPDIYNLILSTSENLDTPKWTICCPHTAIPKKPIVIIVRNPIDRFISALTQTQLDPDQAIDCLINNKLYHFSYMSKAKPLRKDEHFRKQSDFLIGKSHLFKFPYHIYEMFDFLNLKTFPHLNRAKSKKTDISEKHIDFVLDYYKEDLELFNSINNPNTIVNL